MRVGCYIRVSTLEQAQEGYSVFAQTKRLEAYCRAKEWDICGIYTDPGYSGANIERPALQQLISDVEEKQIDLVLVYKLDRLSRSQKDTLYLIEDIFLENGVSFASINENFDTSTPMGRAMIGILSVFAQLEREQIKERCQMGLEERVRSGKWHGGGNPPIGYDFIGGKLLINEFEAMQVKEIFDLYVNAHISLNKIVDLMNAKGYTHKYGEWKEAITVKRILTNETYLGKTKYNAISYEGDHEPLVTQEVFDCAQIRLRERSISTNKTPDKPYFAATQLLSGILFCGNCGGRYYGAGAYRGSKKLPYSQRKYIHLYSCYSRTKTKQSMIKDPSCKNKNWHSEKLDNIIIEEISKLAPSDGYVESLVTKYTDGNFSKKKATIEKKLAELEKKIQKILDLYLYEDIPTGQIAQKLELLTKERKSLKNTLSKLQSVEVTSKAYEAKSILGGAKDVFENGTLEEKRRMVQSLIQSITLEQDHIYIKWRF